MPRTPVGKLAAETEYRYTLTRGTNPERVVWVMLNPSTADDQKDDQTIRKVTRFTELAGYTGFTVVNLTPVRATKPKELRNLRDGMSYAHVQNMRTVLALCRPAELVVAGWGATNLKTDALSCLAAVAWRIGVEIPVVHCLGTTKAGAPRHPCYLSYDTTLRPFCDAPDCEYDEDHSPDYEWSVGKRLDRFIAIREEGDDGV